MLNTSTLIEIDKCICLFPYGIKFQAPVFKTYHTNFKHNLRRTCSKGASLLK